MNQFGREHGIVIEKNGLWCPVCQEALSLKSSSLKDHFATSKHKTGLMKKEKANLVQQNLIKFLESDEAKNELPVGEGTERLALAHLAFRVETMEELMRLGLYQYLDRLRPLLERNNYSLSSKAHLSSMIPMLNHRELDRLGALFNNSDVGLVCDELTYCGCIIGCVARTVTDDLKLIHQLIGMKHIAVSPNSKQLAASINNLCARVHLDPERILTLCTDSASVPRAAADILKNIYAFMTPTNCISHISNNIGKKIDTPRATSFVNDLATLISRSGKARTLYGEITDGSPPPSPSESRWYSKFPLAFDVVCKFDFVHKFLLSYAPNDADKLATVKRMHITLKTDLGLLKLELVLFYENAKHLVWFCFLQEGDGLHLLATTYDEWQKIRERFKPDAPLHATVVAMIDFIAGGDPHAKERLVAHCRNALRPVHLYIAKLEIKHQETLNVFKAARYTHPNRIPLLEFGQHAKECMMKAFKWLTSKDWDALAEEVPQYIACAKQMNPGTRATEFWLMFKAELSCWFQFVKKVMIYVPSSASVERVFSCFNDLFGHGNKLALDDYLELATMKRWNFKTLDEHREEMSKMRKYTEGSQRQAMGLLKLN